MIRARNAEDTAQTDVVKGIQLVLSDFCQRPGFRAVEKDWLDVDVAEFDFSRDGNRQIPRFSRLKLV